MVTDLLPQLFGTKVSDARTEFAKELKLNINMPEKTEQNVLEGIQAMSLRTQQWSDFNRFMIDDLGIKDPNKIQSYWFDYNKDKPFYDTKNHKRLDGNLTSESYKTYMGNKLAGRPTNDKSSKAAIPEGNNEGKLHHQELFG